MKIVRFKNGRYGVRKWSWLRVCYVFVINRRGDWRLRSPFWTQEFDLGFAKEVMQAIKYNKTRYKDMGKIVR